MESGSYGSLADQSEESGYGIDTESTNGRKDTVVEGRKSSSQRLSILFFLTTLASAAILLGALIGKYNEPFESTQFKVTSTYAYDTTGVNWTFARVDYGPLQYFDPEHPSNYTYAKLANYRAIIEPNVPMELYLFEPDADTSYIYKYTVCAGSDCYSGTYKYVNNKWASTKVSIECSPNARVTLKVSRYLDSVNVGSAVQYGLCLYVRREIRSISDSERDKVMDAMYALWSTSEEDGQSLYGSNFHNITYISSAHHFNSAWRDGDHFHEGLGFLVQHLKLTNMFELSMQAVDPSISLPYWDFTIDTVSSLYAFDGYVFTSSMFGSITPPVNNASGWTYTDDEIINARIPDGRWENATIDMNTAYPDLYANFGYMRAPWNANPSPYISRYTGYTTALPTCLSHYQLLLVENFTSFLETVPYGAHSTTHGSIGSVFGCDRLDSMRSAGVIVDYEAQQKLCQQWGFLLKELYRRDLITPRNNCTYSALNYDSIDCSFTCKAATTVVDDDLAPPPLDDTIVPPLNNRRNRRTQSISLFNTSDTYNSIIETMQTFMTIEIVGDLDEEQWISWADFICHGDASSIFVGDHLESASPFDPSFWPIHPTLERLFHYKLLHDGFPSLTWPSDQLNEYVCDKSICYENENDEFGAFSSCCYGHFEYDQMLDFVTGNKSNHIGDTNHDILMQSDPRSAEEYAMNYIFDRFDWSHCPQNFDDLSSGDDNSNDVVVNVDVNHDDLINNSNNQ